MFMNRFGWFLLGFITAFGLLGKAVAQKTAPAQDSLPDPFNSRDFTRKVREMQE
jgi:hypothetical protein